MDHTTSLAKKSAEDLLQYSRSLVAEIRGLLPLVEQVSDAASRASDGATAAETSAALAESFIQTATHAAEIAAQSAQIAAAHEAEVAVAREAVIAARAAVVASAAQVAVDTAIAADAASSAASAASSAVAPLVAQSAAAVDAASDSAALAASSAAAAQALADTVAIRSAEDLSLQLGNIKSVFQAVTEIDDRLTLADRAVAEQGVDAVRPMTALRTLQSFNFNYLRERAELTPAYTNGDFAQLMEAVQDLGKPFSVPGMDVLLEDGPLTIPDGSTCLGPVRFNLFSRPTALDDVDLTIGADCVLDRVAVIVPGGDVSNINFLDVGSNLTVNALSIRTETGAARNRSGVRFTGAGLRAGVLQSKNIDRPFYFMPGFGLAEIGYVDIEGYVRGIRIDGEDRGAGDFDFFRLGGARIVGRSPNAQVGHYPGTNGILIQGLPGGFFGPIIGADSGEHFLRSGGPESGMRGIYFEYLGIKDTGAAAVKLNTTMASGCSLNYTFGVIDVVDIGEAGGDNDCALRVSHARNIDIRLLKIRKANKAYSCKYAILGNDVNGLRANIDAEGCQRYFGFDETVDFGQVDGVSDEEDGGGINDNSAGPVRNIRITGRVGGPGTADSLIAVNMPTWGADNFHVDLTVDQLPTYVLNWFDTPLTGTNTAQDGSSYTLDGKNFIRIRASGTVAPAVNYEIIAQQEPHVDYDMRWEDTPARVWARRDRAEPNAEQVRALESALERWDTAGILAKLSGLSIFATPGRVRRLINVLDKSIFWDVGQTSIPFTAFGGLLHVTAFSDTPAEVFPADTGFVGVYVVDDIAENAYDFGHVSSVSSNNRYRFNSRNSSDQANFRLGGSSDLTVNGSTDARGFWGASWDGDDWEIVRNGTLFGAGAHTFDVMPSAKIAVGRHGTTYSTRRHGALVWGAQRLSVAEIAVINGDVQALMRAVGV